VVLAEVRVGGLVFDPVPSLSGPDPGYAPELDLALCAAALTFSLVLFILASIAFRHSIDLPCSLLSSLSVCFLVLSVLLLLDMFTLRSLRLSLSHAIEGREGADDSGFGMDCTLLTLRGFILSE